MTQGERGEWCALVLRLVVGPIFVAQGYRKVFAHSDAPHGRDELEATLRRVGVPRPSGLARATGYMELGGGGCVLVGLGSRLAVVPLLGILGVAISMVKWRQGFLGGWDWPYSVAGAAIGVLVLGDGRCSLGAGLRVRCRRGVSAAWGR
jgi:uncharacterized membrane protein YphA (DoxX/SURF4 family)